MIVSFAVLGGDADEFARFLQLEWESFVEEDGRLYQEVKRRFYRNLNDYKRYRKDKRDWRTDFDGRDFSKLVV